MKKKLKRFARNGVHIPPIEGVTIKGDYVEFDGRFTDEEIKAIREKIAGAGYSEQEPRQRKTYSPTDAERKKVLAAMSGVESLEGFGFYEAIVADTRLDRHKDILDRSFLEVLAKRYDSGRAVVDSHNERQRIGYTFAASVQPDPDDAQHFQLSVKFYVSPSAKMLSGNSAKSEIDEGLVRRVSVSFMAKEYTYIPGDAEGNMHGISYWLWKAPIESSEDNIEAFELSTVAMGAQAGAVIKGAGISEKARKTLTATFGEIQVKSTVTGMKNIKILDIELQVSEDQEAALKQLEEKAKALETELSKFKEAEAGKKKALVTEFVNLKCKAFEGLDADTETAKAERFTSEELAGEIKMLQAISGNPKHKQLDPSKNKEEKQEKAEGLGFLNFV